MQPPWQTLLRGLLVGLAALLLHGCRSSPPVAAAEPAASTTLLDQKLLEVIELEQALNRAAAQPDADRVEIQRLFQQVDREYSGLIARNPDHLESRLLYGKLLSRFGDSESARDQFLMAAKIDPAIAVIHQELGTYYAEEGDFTRALAYALNAIRLEPETAAYHFGLGQVLAAYRQEFIDEGVFTPEQVDADMLKAFRTASELEPEALDLQFRYGEAFYDVGQPDWATALQHWQTLQKHPLLSPYQQDAIRLHQARCLLELDRAEEARTLARQVQVPELRHSAEALGL